MRVESARDWPDAVAYREAIQSPGLTLGDPLLTGARVAENRQGLPIAYTGRFAVVFRLKGSNGSDWALRCFTMPQDGYGISRGTRYRLLADQIARLDDLFVPFRYVERGIRVLGKWFPTIAMRWATGKTLGRWVEDNRESPARLKALAATLGKVLERLETAGMAHGDWQHDNILVNDDGTQVTLVDYDGMFVQGLEGYPAPELGHNNYQHPLRTIQHYGVGLDRFPCLVIQTALHAIASDTNLWVKHGDGESLLFKSADFRGPENSTLFASLRAIAELDRSHDLGEHLERLFYACSHGAEFLPQRTTEAPKPLPEQYLDREPDPIEKTIKDDDFDWIRKYNEVVTHGKWWQETGGVRRGGQLQAQKDDFRYVNQLQDPLLVQQEKQRLWQVRAALLGVSLMVLLFYIRFVGHVGTAPLFILLWAVNCLAIGYAALWPRRKLMDELLAEISRMGQLIGERKDRIATRTQGASPQALAAARGTAADFIAEKLAQVPINRILTISGINVPTKRQLEAENIQTALDLSRRTNIAGVPPHQVAALQSWCKELESEFADEYRKLTASAKNVSVDVQRLEMEVAEFEREIEKLQRERAQFPDTSLKAYLKALFPFIP